MTLRVTWRGGLRMAAHSFAWLRMITAGLFHAEIAEVPEIAEKHFLRFAQAAGGFQPMVVYSRLEASF